MASINVLVFAFAFFAANVVSSQLSLPFYEQGELFVTHVTINDVVYKLAINFRQKQTYIKLQDGCAQYDAAKCNYTAFDENLNTDCHQLLYFDKPFIQVVGQKLETNATVHIGSHEMRLKFCSVVASYLAATYAHINFTDQDVDGVIGLGKGSDFLTQVGPHKTVTVDFERRSLMIGDRPRENDTVWSVISSGRFLAFEVDSLSVDNITWRGVEAMVGLGFKRKLLGAHSRVTLINHLISESTSSCHDKQLSLQLQTGNVTIAGDQLLHGDKCGTIFESHGYFDSQPELENVYLFGNLFFTPFARFTVDYDRNRVGFELKKTPIRVTTTGATRGTTTGTTRGATSSGLPVTKPPLRSLVTAVTTAVTAAFTTLATDATTSTTISTVDNNLITISESYSTSSAIYQCSSLLFVGIAQFAFRYVLPLQ